jgi:hypothetical protein
MHVAYGQQECTITDGMHSWSQNEHSRYISMTIHHGSLRSEHHQLTTTTSFEGCKAPSRIARYQPSIDDQACASICYSPGLTSERIVAEFETAMPCFPLSEIRDIINMSSLAIANIGRCVEIACRVDCIAVARRDVEQRSCV